MVIKLGRYRSGIKANADVNITILMSSFGA